MCAIETKIGCSLPGRDFHLALKGLADLLLANLLLFLTVFYVVLFLFFSNMKR
jgi:hypothetical protein